MLKSLAVQSVNKGKPSSFYAGEKTNPVLQALASDIRQFQNLIIKKNSKAYKPAKDEASSRAYVVLCHNYMYFASVAHCARKFSNLRLCAYEVHVQRFCHYVQYFCFREDCLFELWNKYEPKLQLSFYQSKLLEVGDFLTSYHVSSFICY